MLFGEKPTSGAASAAAADQTAIEMRQMVDEGDDNNPEDDQSAVYYETNNGDPTYAVPRKGEMFLTMCMQMAGKKAVNTS